MSFPLLATKLFIPPPGKYCLVRPRLLEILDGCLIPGCRLTLVSAPAGYGKTTLVSNWVSNLKPSEDCPPPLIAWLSLDEGDNDPHLFWSYFISSLQAREEGIGKQALSQLPAVKPPDLEGNIALLVNDLAQIPNPCLLILDDFHLIWTPAIHQSLSYFIDHVPQQFHVLILSRMDPPFPLALLRGRGQLLELRLAALRFSKDEAAAYLNEGMGLTLSSDAVEALNAKTEGWVAGLQMAALSMQGRSDTSQFVRSFSGSNRYILDYLVEEVLKRQPAEIQDFLVRISILDIFCSSLCDALTKDTNHEGYSGSQTLLEYLEDSSLFIIPMDDDRYWYRFHHLFADLLKKRLQQNYPDDILPLHRKASFWYEQNGLSTQAIEHCLLAQDFERAIFLINQAAERLFGYGGRAAVARWVDAIPVAELQKNLNLEILRAASLAMDGHIREAESCLHKVEKWLVPAENSDVQQTILEGRILTVHAMIASYREDVDAILFYAPQALEKLADDRDLTWRSWNLVNLANVSLNKGNIDAAIHYLIDGIAAGKATHSPDMALTAMFYYILVLWFKGTIREASQASQEGLDYIADNQLQELPRAGALFMIWGLILCERNELESAEKYIHQGYQLVESENSPLWLELANLIRLRYLIAKGDLVSADRIVREAVRLFSEYEIPEGLAAWIREFITWFWILRGQFPDAEKDFQDHNIRIDRDVAYPYYGEYLSLARLLQAKKEYLASIKLLERIIHRAEIERQFRWVVSGYVLLALAYQAQLDEARALVALENALVRAKPEGNDQPFLDGGEPIKRLLEVASLKGLHAQYVSRLLAAFPGASSRMLGEKDTQKHNLLLIEPLSSREMEVLWLISNGHTNKEIAQKLGISLRTVKFYATSIYSKLGVTGRTQAIYRARELGLLQ